MQLSRTSPAIHRSKKEFPMARRAGVEGPDILRVILSIFLPPLGVFLEVGIGKHFWINIVLTLFGYIPGIVHALYVIFTR